MKFKSITKVKEQEEKFYLSKSCKQLKVSRSGFYNYLKYSQLPGKDFADFKLVNKIFESKNQKIGIRQIKMILERENKVIMNRKKIARIKRKYNMVTRIRVKNKYRFLIKKKYEHKTCKNILNREFSRGLQNEVYSTDITQLNYGSKKAYLAVFKDLCTKEIVAKSISNRIDIKLTNRALDSALKKLSGSEKENLMIHSDQGFHFTHLSFRKKLREAGVTQSMSRRGNCIDNAPVESFFGYLKDHLDMDSCKSLEDVKKMVTREINYYNHKRPQLGLKKMPPSEYRKHLIS